MSRPGLPWARNRWKRRADAPKGGAMTASWTLYVSLGLLAGALTTVAGLGGGMLLLLALATLGEPHEALAVTAPALLVGNLHRLWMGRRELDRETALPLVAGALPGALVGGGL